MSPRLVVVAIELLVNSKNECSFNSQPFATQLADLQKYIENICQLLAADENNAEQWIIAWREHGLTDGQNRYISVDQRKELKTVMKEITAKYPKLTIIAGTVASARHLKSTEQKDVDKLHDAYKNHVLQNENDKGFEKHQEQAMKMPPVDSSAVNTAMNQPDVLLVRNTSYIFRNGKCERRIDKVMPYKETKGLDLDKAVFRPGSGRSLSPIVNKDIALEICLEHQYRWLAHTLSNDQTAVTPTIQFVVSNTTYFKPFSMGCPYLIHIDSVHRACLISDIEAAKAEVKLYRYNILAKNAVLQPTPVMTPAKKTFRYLQSQIEHDPLISSEEYLKIYNGNFILGKQHCDALMISYMMKLLELDHYPKKHSIQMLVSMIADELYARGVKASIDARLLFMAAFGNSAELNDALKSDYLNRTSDYIDLALLLFAIQADDIVSIRILLNKPVNINAAMNNGMTAIIKAVEFGSIAAFTVLLTEPRINVDAALHQSMNTALHIAAKRGSFYMIRKLVEYGANVDVLNSDNKNACQLAQENGYHDIAAYLSANTSTLNDSDYQKLSYLHQQISANASLYASIPEELRSGFEKVLATRNRSDLIKLRDSEILHTTHPHSHFQPDPSLKNIYILIKFINNDHSRLSDFELMAAILLGNVNPNLNISEKAPQQKK